MNFANSLFNTSRINDHYLSSELRPRQIATWLGCVVIMIVVTALRPVQHITGLHPLLMTLILVPHIAINVSHALFTWFAQGAKKFYLSLTMVAVHVNFIMLVGLIIAAGPKPWTPMWAAYLFYIPIVLNAFGFQPYLFVLIATGGMLPWAWYSLIGSSFAPAYFPVCVIVTLIGLAQYSFLGAVLSRSRRMQQLEERLAHERMAADEIQRIWRELHDGVGAHLTQAMLGGRIAMAAIDGNEQKSLRAKALLDALMGNLTDAMNELREAVYLSKDNLEWTPADLANHVRQTFSDAFASKNITLSLTVDDGAPHDPLSPRVTHALRRIIQEALTNVLRHSNAADVELAIRRTAAALSLAVRDNGSGEGPLGDGTGSGIESMRKRATDIGARFEIARGSTGAVEILLECPGALDRCRRAPSCLTQDFSCRANGARDN